MIREINWHWSKNADSDRHHYRYTSVQTGRRVIFAFAYPLEDGYKLRVSDTSLHHLYARDYNGGREAALAAINTHLRRIK